PEGAAAGSLVHYFGHVGPDSARHRMSILLFSLRFGLAHGVHCHPPGFFARLRARRAPMDRWNALKTLTNERGVALPMALITLVLLTTLMLAFAVLSQNEPVIAANQLRTSQARAMEESGFECAVWGLGDSTTPIGVAPPTG